MNDLELKDILKDIQERPTVPLWPHVGKVLDISKSGVYGAAGRGEIEVIRMGRVVRAITAPLRKRLGLEAA